MLVTTGPILVLTSPIFVTTDILYIGPSSPLNMYRPLIVEPTTPYWSLQSRILVIYKPHILSLCPRPHIAYSHRFKGSTLIPAGPILVIYRPILVHTAPYYTSKGPNSILVIYRPVLVPLWPILVLTGHILFPEGPIYWSSTESIFLQAPYW